jgi:hypothetical protein
MKCYSEYCKGSREMELMWVCEHCGERKDSTGTLAPGYRDYSGKEDETK